MATLLDQAQEKRQEIISWGKTAISLEEAQKRGLVIISKRIFWRCWAKKEFLFDFAKAEAQASPVLVKIDERRVALFTEHRTHAVVTTRQTAWKTQRLSLADKRLRESRRDMALI